MYELLRNGVPVQVRNEDGSQSPERVQLIDWRNPGNQRLLLVSQFGSPVTSTTGARICGLRQQDPAGVRRVKASHKKRGMPTRETCVTCQTHSGAVHSKRVHHLVEWLSIEDQDRVVAVEHFAEWKKIDEESGIGVVSLETMLQGTCDPARLLDIVENFIAFR